jgi:hypothetical protein
VERVGELRASGEPPGHEQEAGLAGEQGRLRRRRHLASVAAQVRLGTPELERPPCGRGEIDPRLRVPAAAQRVERPDDSAGADVELLQRRRRLPQIPLVRRPQPDRVERVVGIGDDRVDRRADTRLVPLFVGERLERVRLLEH